MPRRRGNNTTQTLGLNRCNKTIRPKIQRYLCRNWRCIGYALQFSMAKYWIVFNSQPKFGWERWQGESDEARGHFPVHDCARLVEQAVGLGRGLDVVLAVVCLPGGCFGGGQPLFLPRWSFVNSRLPSLCSFLSCTFGGTDLCW